MTGLITGGIHRATGLEAIGLELDAERAAVARAEWFVTDFFMVDQEPQGSAAIRAAV